MSNIKELFYKMEYDGDQVDDFQSPNRFEQQLNASENRLSSSWGEIKSGIDPIKRAIVIKDIADALENNFETLVYAEIKFRYFNKKDANVSVKGLIENLRYYAGCTFSSVTSDIDAIIRANKYMPLSMLGREIGNKLAVGCNVLIEVTNDQILPIIKFIESIFIELGYMDYISSRKNLAFVDEIHEKTPMIVFNDADLESASYSAIQAVWGFQGLMFWNVNTIFVQEAVFDDFVTLIKEKLSSKKIPHDISKPRLYSEYATEFNNLRTEAAKRGFQYWASHDDDDFSPLLIIEDRLIENNVNGMPKYRIPFATVLPFRHTPEAIALANNRREHYAASIWTENIGLANEVSRKLQAGTVWVNSHGQFRPEIFCPKYNIKRNVTDKDEKADKKTFITANMKVQKSWGGLSANARQQQLRKVGFKLQNNFDNYIDRIGLTKTELEEWIRVLIEVKSSNTESLCDGFSHITSYREPIGIISLATSDIKFAIYALSNGNVLLTHEKLCEDKFNKMMDEIGKCIPGIIKCVHDGLMSTSDLQICNSDLYMDAEDYGYLTSRVKNIWYNFEDSI